MTKIYDWRGKIIPNDQLFIAAGQETQGQRTLGGFNVTNPEPGGVASLRMTVAMDHSAEANRAASWLASIIQNGRYIRIPIKNSVQLVSSSALGLTTGGLTWSNGQKWSNGQFWRFSPKAAVAGSASKGAATVSINMSGYGQVLEIGHVIGFKSGDYDFAHHVEEVSYSGNTATVTISPPLRRAVTTSDECELRPKMIARCVNPQDAIQGLKRRQYMAFSQLDFVEVLL